MQMSSPNLNMKHKHHPSLLWRPNFLLSHFLFPYSSGPVDKMNNVCFMQSYPKVRGTD